MCDFHGLDPTQTLLIHQKPLTAEVMSMHQTFHKICKAWMALNRSWQVPRLTFTAHEKLSQLPVSDMETIDCLQLCMTFSDKRGK